MEEIEEELISLNENRNSLKELRETISSTDKHVSNKNQVYQIFSQFDNVREYYFEYLTNLKKTLQDPNEMKGIDNFNTLKLKYNERSEEFNSQMGELLEHFNNWKRESGF